MAQIKIYGLKAQLGPIKAQLSEVIHACAIEALQLPPDKRFHRFFNLEPEDFYYPPDRSKNYLILEISIFEGRSIATKKRLLHLLFKAISEQLAIAPQDVEITISETPRYNWGIRGLPGDEIGLNYKVEV